MIKTISDCACTRVRYNEFPDLLFGTTANGQEYFDATHFIMKKGDTQKHNVRQFEMLFLHWKKALCEAYDILLEDVVVVDKEQSHVLIDEAFALLFVSYVDPMFGVYMLERMSEMLINGLVLSDTNILMMSRSRLTKEQLSNLTNEK